MLRTDSIPKSTSLLVVCSTVIAVLMLMTLESPAQVNQQSKTVRVFILAGQSNMQGHGVVDLDHPEHYNGGKGNLESAMKKKANSKRMRHLKGSNGNWSVRDDVFCWYQTENELKTGGLTIGFSGYSGAPHHFGPELQLGHVLGDAFDDPVLLIKTAWGGKSLANDFRPPSSKAELGPYYIKMLRQIGAAINQFESKIPQLKGYKPIIEGFVWQQGWNDMIDDQATAEYEQNLRHLISDLRQQFGVDGLPFVIGELGNGGEKTNQKMKRFRAAQMAAARHGDRNVAFVKTTHCARPANQSPNQGHGHHWFGNAESYFFLGEALGLQMVDLIESRGKPRVLILGDSISIGYTPFVKRMMPEFFVTRPMRGKNAENCSGTDKGIQEIDRWIHISGGNWDVIHFNFGLHDLKHVDAESGKNSNNPDDPLQSPPKDYERQLQEIVDKLKATKAKSIFCTTTPVPPGCKPLRETTSPAIYNQIGIRIAEKNGIAINDLYHYAESRLEEIQIPSNVHFTPKGSEILAMKVTESIRAAIQP